MLHKKRWIQYLIPFLMLGILCVVSFSAHAQKKNKRQTAINFEDELVQGEAKKPELLYLLQKKQFNFKRLIRLRENFLPEMRRTAEDIQPDRGGR